MDFLKEAVRAPHITGAIAPSGRQLARVIVEKADVPRASRILELGPGTGAFTRRIIEAKRHEAHFVALERNRNFALGLRSRFPNTRIIEGCATELRTHAEEHGFDKADSIVSGLPWAIFDPHVQETILRGVRDVLADGGTFATFAYFGPHLLPNGKSFRKLLKSIFPNTRTSSVIVRNLPPAFVYYCRK